MSDVFPGPGWWLASDGLWYDASTHPDPTYREAFAVADGEDEVVESVVEQFDDTEESLHETVEDSVEADVAPVRDFPSVEITPPLEGVGESGNTSQIGSVIRSASHLRESDTEDLVEEDLEADVEEHTDEHLAEVELAEEVMAVPAVSAPLQEGMQPPPPPEVPVVEGPPALSFEAPVVEPVEAAPEEVDAELVEADEDVAEADTPEVETDEDVVDIGEDVREVELDASEVELENIDEEMIPEVTTVEQSQLNGTESGITRSGWSRIESDDETPKLDVPAELEDEPELEEEPELEDATDAEKSAEPSVSEGRPSAKTQSEAFDQARRERLAEAQKSAERLRDSVRQARARGMNGSEVDTDPATQRPTLSMRAPGAGPSVTAAAAAEPVTRPSVAGRTKLEIQGDNSSAPSVPTLGLVTPESTSTSTALVHVPAGVASVDRMDRVLSVLLFFSGLAMIAGTFMVWTTGPVDEVGWDRSDGIVVVVAGVVAATAAGPLFAGVRSFARGLAIVAGVVAVMVTGVVGIVTLTNSEQTGLSIGSGLFVVLAAAVAAIIASATIRNEPFY